MSEPALTSAAVPGGDLTVATWGDGDLPVLALHGITATHRAFPYLAAALPEARIVAPDLRGRGGSRSLPEPFGMAAHADDAAAAVRALVGEPVVVVGHSMGGFVAAVLADRHPSLVQAVVLVDGGLPFAPAEMASTEAGLAAIRQRLETTFASAEDYRAFYRAHPAFARDWTPEVAAYADYDLVGEPPSMRPSASVAAVVADQRDLGEGSAVADALVGPLPPMRFLHSDRGFVDDPPGLYAAETVAEHQRRWPDVAMSLVPDVNHYTIVMSARGADAVAAAVRALA